MNITQLKIRMTEPLEMDLYLGSRRTLRETLEESSRLLELARNPMSKFGLTPEQTSAVIPICEMYFEGAQAATRHIAKRIEEMKAEGLAWDEVWGQLDGLGGFGPGDWTLIQRAMRPGVKVTWKS